MKRLSLGGAALVIIGLTLYAPLLRAGFVYDDFWRVVQNPAIRTVRPAAFLTDRATVAMRESGLVTDIYNPLTTLSYSVDYRLFGLAPLPYHLENLLLHLLNTMLLAWIVWRLGKNPWVAWIAGLIFLIHPTQVQGVAWISQRSTVLSASAVLGALAFLTIGTSRASRLAGVVCYALALFAKETAITFPLLYGIVVWWGLRNARPEDRKISSQRAGLVLVSLLAVGFMFLIWRAHVLGQWTQQAEGFEHPLDELGLGFLAFPVYVGKLLIPTALRPSYLYPQTTLWHVSLAGIAWTGWALAVWKSWTRYPTVTASLGWIFAALLPALHLMSLRTFVGERFLYLPMIGFAVLVAVIAEQSRTRRTAAYAWILFLLMTTALALPAWKDESSLWAAAIRAEPENAFSQSCYAGTLREPDHAIERYRLVLTLKPADSIRLSALINLAHLSLVQQRPQDALDYSRQALHDEPENLNALYDICLALAATGHEDAARRVYQKLLSNPQTPAGLLAALAAELKTHGIQ